MKSRGAHVPLVRLSTTLVLLASLLMPSGLGVVARTDSPAGIAIETRSSTPISNDRGTTLQELRIIFDPGAHLVLPHRHGPMIVTVESGELTVTIADQEVFLTRAEGTTSYMVKPLEHSTLDPGDKMTFEFTGKTDVLENQGSTPLVVDISFTDVNGQTDFAIGPTTPALPAANRCISCH